MAARLTRSQRILVRPTEAPFDPRPPAPARSFRIRGREPSSGLAQRELGVDAERSRAADEREQQVAEIVEALAGGLYVGQAPQPRLELLGRRRVRPGPTLDARGERERRQVLRHVGERAVRTATLARALDLLPVAPDRVGTVDDRLAEHVGMAADQLLAAVVGDRGEIAGAALLEEQREEMN